MFESQVSIPRSIPERSTEAHMVRWVAPQPPPSKNVLLHFLCCGLGASWKESGGHSE